MRREHSYSENHKVVTDSPHSYSEGGSCYADGGDVDYQPKASPPAGATVPNDAPTAEQAATAAARATQDHDLKHEFTRKQFLEGDKNAY